MYKHVNASDPYPRKSLFMYFRHYTIYNMKETVDRTGHIYYLFGVLIRTKERTLYVRSTHYGYIDPTN